MTYEQQNQIRKMLENIDKDYLLTFLMSQMCENHSYNYENTLATTTDFIQSVKEFDEKKDK